MPKVSVIIPVYNVENYVRECLDSVINQTLKDIEIICINDGSTDNSLEILNEYARKDERFTVLSQENSGAGAARNRGLDIAKGEFIAFMDPDDLYPNHNTLEALYNSAIEKGVMVCGGSSVELVEGQMIYPKREGFRFEENSMIDYKDYQCIYGYWRFIYNLKFLKENDINFPKYRRFQDPVFCLKALHKAGKIYVISDTVYVYRIQKHGDDYYTEKRLTDLVKGMKEVIQYAEQNKLYEVISRMRDKVFKKFYLDMFENLKIDGVDSLRYLFEPKSLSDEQIEHISDIFQKQAVMARFKSRKYIKYFFHDNGAINEYSKTMQKPDYVIMWGNALWKPQPETLKYAIENDISVLKAEDGFLRSADTWCNTTVNMKYVNGISFTFTNDVLYFDATCSSYTERQINNPKFKLTEEQKIKARNAIDFIVKNHLTKYNHQPIYTPNIGRIGVPKVLVVDQSYGDNSIKKGLADDNTFKDMLESAIKENPNADIIVKTHPDALAPGTKKAMGYYSTLNSHGNIYVLREPINPISLLKCVDKVYVCTTQLGFEALMCGKEVHTFGMPFYAGWGLTIDKQKCERRTIKRTLEEIFYIMYIKNSYYIDPVNKCPCSIERAMEYLIELRDEYKNNPVPPAKKGKSKEKASFIENIFSVRNVDIRKVITIFGIKFKFKSDKLKNKTEKRKIEKTKLLKNTIVSLTSYPARINTVNQTIESLLNQTLKPEKIILVLGEDKFPNKEKDLPKELLELLGNEFEILWCKDMKSYTKLIPTLKKYPDKIIITADDDIIYEEDRIEKLYKDYLKNPNMIHCHRAHRILFNKKQLLPYSSWQYCIKYVRPSYNNFLTGVGMVLYPVNCFYKDVLRDDLFMKLCPQADDIWFWAMVVLNNYKINVVEDNYKGLKFSDGSQNVGLWYSNVLGNKNDIQMQNVLKYYPKIMKRLDKSNGLYENDFEKIFSVKNYDSKKVITILGVKFKIKSKKLVQKQKMQAAEKQLKKYERIILKQERKIERQELKIGERERRIERLELKIENSNYNDYKNFISHFVKNKSVLLVEMNKCHSECLPGIAKYFVDLGYNVDILLNKEEDNLNPFFYYKNEKISIYSAYPEVIKEILHSDIIEQYEILYINSDKVGNRFLTTYLGNDIKSPSKKTIVMCHHAEVYDEIKFNVSNLQIVTLANLLALKEKDYKCVNTHYFKEIDKHNKNEIIKFVTVGNIETNRRNHSNLIETVEKLDKQGITNFKISVISRVGSIDIPQNLMKYFEIKSKLSYPDMYKEVEQADFLLTLFDPDNIEHERYITSGVSGTYQLSYGFNIPVVIPYKFQTDINGFNDLNSIGYKDNNDLINAMKLCINMEESEYCKYKSNLSVLEKKIYDVSFNNLKEIVNSSESELSHEVCECQY